MEFKNKNIRTFCIKTVLSFEGQFLCYELSYPVSKEFIETYGSSNIISRKYKSKNGKQFNLNYFIMTSVDFIQIKKQKLQLQLLASSLRLAQEQRKNSDIHNKISQIYDFTPVKTMNERYGTALNSPIQNSL